MDLTKPLRVIDHSDLSPIEKARARALARSYGYQWERFDGTFVAAELDLSVVLKETDGWTLAGTIDTLCKRKGKYVMIEHKTRTGDVCDISDGYYRSLAHNTQITLYCILLGSHEHEIEQTIYDVIRKIGSTKRRVPAGKIVKTKKEDIESLTEEQKLSKGIQDIIVEPNLNRGTCLELQNFGSYYGMTCSTKELVRLAKYNQLKEEKKTCGPFMETTGLYEHRITVDVAENSDKYYKQFGQIHRSYEQMGSFVETLKQICRQIDSIDHDKEDRWAQNTSQCNSYGTPCEYMSICSNRDDLASDNYQDRKGGSTSGDRVLSHSKMTCYLSCPRKYYYRYIKKREHARIKPPALKFGQVFHEFLAEFWEGR